MNKQRIDAIRNPLWQGVEFILFAKHAYLQTVRLLLRTTLKKGTALYTGVKTEQLSRFPYILTGKIANII